MAGLGNITMPECSYKVHTSAYDDAGNTAIFYAIYLSNNCIHCIRCTLLQDTKLPTYLIGKGIL